MYIIAIITNASKTKNNNACHHHSSGKLGSLYSPIVGHASPGKYSAVENRIPHEAGYDSYIAGYVFLRLAHFVTTRVSEVFLSFPLSFPS